MKAHVNTFADAAIEKTEKLADSLRQFYDDLPKLGSAVKSYELKLRKSIKDRRKKAMNVEEMTPLEEIAFHSSEICKVDKENDEREKRIKNIRDEIFSAGKVRDHHKVELELAIKKYQEELQKDER